MTGKAKDIAELIPDELIQDDDGVGHIIRHFEARYADILSATTDAELDDLIYQGARASAKTFGEYIQDVQTAWDKYEKAIRPETLPTRMKVRMLLRHAKLTEAQAGKVTTWLGGSRDLDEVKSCLTRLDHDREVTDALVGRTGGNRSFFDEDASGEPEAPYEWGDAELDWAPGATGAYDPASWEEGSWYDNEEEEADDDCEPDELAIYYQDEAYDVGEDSDDEDEVWVWSTDLEANLDADELEQSFCLLYTSPSPRDS